jgi:hypothetical protein
MSMNMKPIQMYECQHCKKLFKTPNKHNCRRDPNKTNCYTCEHWGHQFYIDWAECYYSSKGKTCDPSDACKATETNYGDCAFELMRENDWKLNCPAYKRKEAEP